MADASLGTPIATQLAAVAETFWHTPSDVMATLAAIIGIGLVIAGAFVRTMMPLRWLAAGSNLALVLFGALRPSPITLIIAAVLLPINVFRAIEITLLTRRVRRAEATADMATLWLKPYMKSRRLKAGETLFAKGDGADRMFLLVDGEMELVEIGRRMEAGRIFGEIALFSPDKVRTNTIRCATACTVLEIHETTVKQLFYQNPSFGFHLVELLTERLRTDVERAQHSHLPPGPERSGDSG